MEKKAVCDCRHGTATTLFSDSKTLNKKQCILCGRSNHVIDKCSYLTKISPQDRKKTLRKNRICFKCLSNEPKHQFKKCKLNCRVCKGKHHVLLCDKKLNSVSNINVSSSAVQTDTNETDGQTQTLVSDNLSLGLVASSSLTSANTVLLQVARMKVGGARGISEAVVMFDTGADRSYVTQGLVDKVGPSWLGAQEVACATFGNQKTDKVQRRNVYNMNLIGSDGCSTPVRNGEITVDILIGLDWYWRLVSGEIKSISDGLVAQKTNFGWIVSGRLEKVSRAGLVNISHQLLCVDVKESLAHKFWDLESVGIRQAEVACQNETLKNFENNITYKNGRYVVGLPWKGEAQNKLLNNFGQAKARLDRLKAKLDRDPEVKREYHHVIQSMHDMGIIEEVTEDSSAR
ncbi:hypothetical protein Ahia01_001004700, partial [Argonauta hians]